MQENDKGTESPDSSGDGSLRGRFDRRTFLGAAATTGAAALAGCTGGGDGGESGGSGGDEGGDTDSESGDDTDTTEASGGKQGGTLQWGGAVPVQGLDPHIDTSAASKRVLENVYEEVVALQDDYSIEPHLAKSFDQSDDNTLLTFELREGVMFHNGKEMTSEDVLASYERVQNGDYLATGFFEFVDELRAPDDYTFEIKLNQPFAPFLAKMATAELSVMPAENAAKDMVEEPIGTGPYKFESREIETSFTMVRNEDYWGASDEDGPFIDKIVKSEIPDPSVRLQSFLAGEYDFINGIAPKDVSRVEQAPDVRFEKQFPKSLVYLGMNCDVAPFDNKDARLALDYAIDKEKVAEAALYGTGQTTASPAAPGSPWVNPDVEPRPRDLEKAQEHLDAAGMSDGYTATFKIPQSYPTQVQAAEVIAADAAEVGINLEIQQITWSTWLSDVYSKRDFQATTSSYLALWYPDVSFYKFLHPDGAFFFTNWTNDEYNSLVEEARTIYDEDERAELYHEATQILHDERAGHMFLWWQPSLYGAASQYKGDIGAPDGSTLQFSDNWLDR
ncbi:ABC transporter substrate-binding protein [Haloferax sp. MBLA0076]|uniref:ABC transporter substrate-binding protein n=1 Tax=Haloferax litoreum TaxID=2666140 RepID=A0A6A8GNX3_9EURY|nr:MULTISPECIES: ABC transporter substrate-binding protein [Haloferax]KAB1189911.1 ABC transporter substrate-binding protein [Haloferax sp. CBA1148]MRX23680.1 ABC transporter substrate-binding protein [Haloferax litoreum]